MFDSHAVYAKHIRRVEGEVLVEARYPTDAEWLERSRSMRMYTQELGRGTSKFDFDTGQIDLALYNKIRQDGSPDLDPVEATHFILNIVCHCDIMDTHLDGDQGTVELRVTNGERVKITMRLPTTAEIMLWKRGQGTQYQLPHGKSQFRPNMQATLDLYAKCAKGAEGYTNGMPVQHQDAAMRALIDHCERETQPANEDF